MKGQEWVGGIFTLLLAGIVAGVAMPAILPGQALKVAPAADASEFENKAVLIADSLLGNRNLIHFGITSNSYSRGVFDKDKLDAAESDPSGIVAFYPDTLVTISIQDMETGKWWIFQTKDAGSENVKQYLKCLESGLADPATECPKRMSAIMLGGFPVAIRYGDGTHIGRLEVKVIE